MTSILNRVRALIERLSPQPICDDCITERLGLSDHQHIDHKTRELAGMAGLERRQDVCALCAETKPVIRKRQ